MQVIWNMFFFFFFTEQLVVDSIYVNYTVGIPPDVADEFFTVPDYCIDTRKETVRSKAIGLWNGTVTVIDES